MHVDQQISSQAPPGRGGWWRGTAFPLRSPASSRGARYGGTMVPPAVIACMVEARRPTRQEIEAVAARIWSDTQGGARGGWRRLAAGSHDHRRMLAFARAALGIPPAAGSRDPAAAPEQMS